MTGQQESARSSVQCPYNEDETVPDVLWDVGVDQPAEAIFERTLRCGALAKVLLS